MQQRSPRFPHRRSRTRRNGVAAHAGRRQVAIEHLDQLGHIAVSDRHPFRHPGSARGVDDVGNIVSQLVPAERCRGEASTTGSLTSMDGGTSYRSSRVAQRGSGNRRNRLHISQHEIDARVAGKRNQSADRPPRSSAPPQWPMSLGQQSRTATPHTHRGQPMATNACARPSDARRGSRYVIDRPSNVTATASGARATCAANSSGSTPAW